MIKGILGRFCSLFAIEKNISGLGTNFGKGSNFIRTNRVRDKGQGDHAHQSRTSSTLLIFTQTKYNLTKPCNVWYYPTPVADAGFSMCDPWQTQDFSDAMQQVPGDYCSYCLPDCVATIYDTSITNLPLRSCDKVQISSVIYM